MIKTHELCKHFRDLKVEKFVKQVGPSTITLYNE